MAYGAESAATVKRGVVAPRLEWTAQDPVKIRKEKKRRERKARKAAQENSVV